MGKVRTTKGSIGESRARSGLQHGSGLTKKKTGPPKTIG